VIVDDKVIKAFVPAYAAHVGFNAPRASRGEGGISKGKDAVVKTDPPGSDRYGAETEKRAVEKPENKEQPDRKDNNVFPFFFQQGMPEEEEYASQRCAHDGILHIQGSDEKYFGFHGLDWK
jgi:hypothetical protein